MKTPTPSPSSFAPRPQPMAGSGGVIVAGARLTQVVDELRTQVGKLMAKMGKPWVMTTWEYDLLLGKPVIPV